MSGATQTITPPDDLPSCHALIEQLAGTVQEQANNFEELNRQHQELQLAYAELLQRAYLKRRERYIHDPRQLALDFGDSDQACDAAEGLAQAVQESEQTVRGCTRRRQSRKPRDEKFQDHLPRYEVEATVPEEMKHCPEHGDREVIGHDTTETLEFERPKLRVRVTKYPKYACPKSPECGVGSPERPTGLVEGNRYDTSVAAEVITGKYGYPLESSVVLAKFQQLYDIEDRAKNFSPEERLALRQEEAAPIWASLGEWLEGDAAARVLPKSKLAEALGYLRRHWEPLQLYLSDGLMPIDNNEVEQLMKQVAIGRKNWLFVGSIAAGERAADFMTLVSSAVRNDLDVWAYVKDVLDQLLAGSTDYHSLRPDVWKQSHPEAVRIYRTQERRDRADRKQLRRRFRRRPRPPT